MDNFISTFVFLLPGFFMYFWIQAFGINPVVKHTTVEMGAISALLWLPVSLITIFLYNEIGHIYGAEGIWTLEQLKNRSGGLDFLAWFSLLSVPTSFILSFCYVKFLNPIQRNGVNSVRKAMGLAPFSPTSTVWEEFFIRKDRTRNKGELPVIVHKIDKPTEYIAGIITKTSRPFETERSFVLDKHAELQESYDHFKYEIGRVYVDLKSGMVVKEVDVKKPTQNENDF